MQNAKFFARQISAAVLVSFISVGSLIAGEISSSPDPNTDVVASQINLVTEIDDRAAFDLSYPHAKRVDFDHAAGKTAPFRVDGVRISGDLSAGLQPQVIDSLVGLPANFWFGAQATTSDFLLSNITTQLTFPHDVTAMGFDIQCFGCDDPDNPKAFTAILLNASGELVGYEQPALILTGDPTGSPSFLGFSSDTGFRSVIFERNANWMIMNLRYLGVDR
jgi:hypothetical protein